jgi:hypothetical protein
LWNRLASGRQGVIAWIEGAISREFLPLRATFAMPALAPLH